MIGVILNNIKIYLKLIFILFFNKKCYYMLYIVNIIVIYTMQDYNVYIFFDYEEKRRIC